MTCTDSVETCGPVRRAARVIGRLLGGIWAFVLWLVAGVAGVIFVAAGMHGIRNASMGYTPVTATVTQCTTSVTRGGPTTSSRNSYFVRVGLRYAYRVGAEYRPGAGLLGVGRTGSLDDAREMETHAAATFAAGRPVRVFVNPEDPARSTLEREGRINGLPVLLFGVLFLFLVIAMPVVSTVNALRRRRNLKELQTDRFLNAVVIVIMAGLALSALVWGAANEPRTTAIVVTIAVVGAVSLALRAWRARTKPRASASVPCVTSGSGETKSIKLL